MVSLALLHGDGCLSTDGSPNAFTYVGVHSLRSLFVEKLPLSGRFLPSILGLLALAHDGKLCRLETRAVRGCPNLRPPIKEVFNKSGRLHEKRNTPGLFGENKDKFN